MAAADRISALPNDVLLRILSFAPTNEAAATTLLSRRWRSVWRRTSAINLDSRPYAKAERDLYYCTPTLEDFFDDAHDILAALRQPRKGSRRRRHGAGLKTLELFLEEGAYYISKSWRTEGDEAEPGHRAAKHLADPAVARLEELSIGCGQGPYKRVIPPPRASLPCAATLRVLELTNCNLEPPSTVPSSLAFPCMTDLTLRNCFFLEGYLQDMVDAAAALTSMTLVNVKQKAAETPGSDERFYEWDYFRLPLRLRCPTVTALVLVTFVDKKETSLRKVTLRFKAKEVNCFPVQLAKFLAENAMVLEEMHVEDGNQFWTDHLCHKVGMWRAAESRRKNLPDTAAGFRARLPLTTKILAPSSSGSGLLVVNGEGVTISRMCKPV
uniref:Uncharacterized protein n=1 Tax=Aegilops tauschii TaxID=37682 RepID=M8AZD4_AEGTA